MSTVYVLCCLLSAWETNATEPARGSDRAIEIVIAGPKGHRDRMDATIRPLLGNDPNVHWAEEDSLPANGNFFEAGPNDVGRAGRVLRIWIDVSTITRLRVYLPPVEAEGAATIRTLKRAESGGDGADLLAIEEVGQIVKAAVLTLRRRTANSVDALQSFGDGGSVPGMRPGPSAGEVLSERSSTTGRHAGLFLRLRAGYGFVRMAFSNNGGPYEQYGPVFGAALGAKVADDLSLYGDLQVAGTGPGKTGTYELPSFVVISFGPGVAYSVEPIHVHLSGSIGLAKLVFHGDSDYGFPSDPDIGYFGSFAIGKDWRISPNWGLGVAAQYSRAWLVHYGLGREFYVTTVSLLLSATYN